MAAQQKKTVYTLYPTMLTRKILADSHKLRQMTIIRQVVQVKICVQVFQTTLVLYLNKTMIMIFQKNKQTELKLWTSKVYLMKSMTPMPTCMIKKYSRHLG